MEKVILYGTLVCHLCEQAEELLKKLEDKGVLQVEKKDIIDEPAWMEAYRIRIPVLAFKDKELNWPFDEQQVIDWVNSF